MSSRVVRLFSVVAAAALIAACADDDGTTGTGLDSAVPAAEDPQPATDPPPTTADTAAGTASVETDAAETVATTATTAPTTPPTDATTSSVTPVPDWSEVEWITHRGDPNDPSCRCADGSEHMFHSLERDPDRVLLYYQGGGACFSVETCDFVDGTYKVTTGEDDHPVDGTSGIWDWDQPGNPFADWSVVFVPYCSGDVFQGDAERVYSPELTVQHRGALHAQKGLDYVVETFPEASQLFVTGSSAGGVPAPKIGGLAADALPDTEITVLADASGGYADRQPLNAAIGQLWGTAESLPDWPELDGVDPATIGIPTLFTLTGRHAPRVTLSRFDNAHDQVQQTFSSLAGGDTTVLDVLVENETATEAAGVELDVYIAPGTDHTILGRPTLWTLEVDGVAFLDWLTALVAGDRPGDVRCTDCGQPAG